MAVVPTHAAICKDFFFELQEVTMLPIIGARAKHKEAALKIRYETVVGEAFCQAI